MVRRPVDGVNVRPAADRALLFAAALDPLPHVADHVVNAVPAWGRSK